MQKSVITPVERLETALKSWEQRLLVVQALCALNALPEDAPLDVLSGSVAYWDNLRTTLLHRKQVTESEFGTQQWVVDNFFSHSDFFELLPFFLEAWSTTSRRVYNLSPELQASLEMTSLGKISLSDINPPFPCFGIHLPDPIKWELEGATGLIDFLFVNFYDDRLAIAGLGPDSDTLEFMPAKKIFRLKRAIRDGELGIIRSMLSGPSGGFPGMPQNQFATIRISSDPITKVLGEKDYETRLVLSEEPSTNKDAGLPAYWQLIFRTVAVLCLHLEDLSYNSRNTEIRRTSWAKNISAQKPLHERLITDEALICAVERLTPLSLDEIQAHATMRASGGRNGGYCLGPGFRAAHLRRRPHAPPGQKTVHVKTYSYGLKSAPAVGVPVGAEVLVK